MTVRAILTVRAMAHIEGRVDLCSVEHSIGVFIHADLDQVAASSARPRCTGARSDQGRGAVCAVLTRSAVCAVHAISTVCTISPWCTILTIDAIRTGGAIADFETRRDFVTRERPILVPIDADLDQVPTICAPESAFDADLDQRMRPIISSGPSLSRGAIAHIERFEEL